MTDDPRMFKAAAQHCAYFDLTARDLVEAFGASLREGEIEEAVIWGKLAMALLAFKQPRLPGEAVH